MDFNSPNSPNFGQKFRIEKMQNQIKKFQDDLQGAQEEFKEKIKSLDSIHLIQSDFNVQVRQLSDQLASERSTNMKLNADLSKSLELNLQLQLEVQAFKARTLQSQAEEKRYHQSLIEKQRALQKEIDGLYEAKSDLEKTLAVLKSSSARDQQDWLELRKGFEMKLKDLERDYTEAFQEKERLTRELNQTSEKCQDQEMRIEQQDKHIDELSLKLEDISVSFNQVENSALQQNDVLKNLMSVAENKIVEMKLALDKKSAESQEYYAHLQQVMTQVALLKQENTNFKDYIARLTYYIQNQGLNPGQGQQSHQAQNAGQPQNANQSQNSNQNQLPFQAQAHEKTEKSFS